MIERRKSFRPEIIVCFSAIILVIFGWLEFAYFFFADRHDSAALSFIYHHFFDLNEDPREVIETSRGIYWDWGLLLASLQSAITNSSGFQLSLVLVLLIVLGLGWLTYRLWRAQRQEKI